MQSVSWNVRPSTSTGALRRARGALEERRRAQDRVVALPGPRAVARAAVEDEVGVDDADAARVHVAAGRLADERERRAPEQPRLARAPRGCRSRGSGPPRGRRRRRRPARSRAAQCSSTARIAASPPFMSAAPRPITRVPSQRGSWPSQGGTVSRWPTSATASSRSPDAHDERVAEALDRDARERAAARLDEIGERGLLAGHARDGDELEREPREGLGVDVNGSAPAGGRRCAPGRRRPRARWPRDPTRPRLLSARVLPGAQRDLGRASRRASRRPSR